MGEWEYDENTPLVLDREAVKRRQRKRTWRICVATAASCAIALCVILIIAIPFHQARVQTVHNHKPIGVQSEGGARDVTVTRTEILSMSDTVAMAPIHNGQVGGDSVFQSAGGGGDSVFQSAEGGGDSVFQSAEGGGHSVFQSAEGGGHSVFQSAEGGGHSVFQSAEGGGDSVFQRAEGGGDSVFQSAEGGGDSMQCGLDVFTNTDPFSAPVWPLPQCFTPVFQLWRKDMETPKRISINNKPLRLFSCESWEYKAYESTVYLVHGWLGDGTEAWLHRTKGALLQLKEKMNVIIVDWGEGAAAPYYPQAASNVRVAGATIARLNDFLAPAYSYCVGHSLGAHVCAHADKHGANLDRITGLDPAGPLFDAGRCAELPELCRLHPTDARQVDVIHTDGEVAGTLQPLGRIDFYPNGGVDQPGCSETVCDHNRACELFESSILHPCFHATHACADALHIPGSCVAECTPGRCPQMGYWTKFGKGAYTLNTTAQAPYCSTPQLAAHFSYTNA